MILITVIAVAMLGLSSVALRSSQHDRAMTEARANARMALTIALGELQKNAGPDQRTTARAAILENPTGGPEQANRNWLGVWKTTYQVNGREYPLIGKKSSASNDGSPYARQGIYSDLRETDTKLKQGKWRSVLLESWLVSSRSQSPDPSLALSLEDDHVLEILGKGTLGGGASASAYARNRVLVEKVEVDRHDGRPGAYAWYISDNNQKASMALDPAASGDVKTPFLASQTDNPAAVQTASGAAPYADYLTTAKGSLGKVASYKSAAMAGHSDSQRQQWAHALGSNFHDLTHDASGLFVDTTLGALKRDLTPLLFGKPDDDAISLKSPGAAIAKNDFSSDDPIIPGNRHGVLGPSFGALRFWGRTKYLDGLASGTIAAQQSHRSNDSTYLRPVADWPQNTSDRLTFDAGKWASQAPKIHPVMTDCRWHYYFGHTDNSSTQSFQTHIIPRVCLWNPYNISMQTKEWVVLMPNPFFGSSPFVFNFEQGEVTRMRQKYASSAQYKALMDSWNGALSTTSPTAANRAGLFPDSRYLGFVLEPTTFGPGECLVFSPLINAGDEGSQGVNILKYNKDNISANVLSASAPQGEHHFVHDFANGSVALSNGTTWQALDWAVFKEMNLSAVSNYECWAYFYDNFPFVLKAANASTATTTLSITTQDTSSFPTLQLINNGNGGVATYDFWMYAWWWGNSTVASNGQFGNLTSFQETPRKNPPAVHQIGTKLLWLDESATEANFPPLRVGLWPAGHLAYNPAPVAHWNVRPGLVTRSPSSPCALEWYVNSCGAWLLQFAPYTPQDINDLPSLNKSRTCFSKSPMGAALQFSASPDALMFDLPDARYGALSLGSLRHAQLSPYSWHPTYIVGQSLADIHAPYETSAHPSLASTYAGSEASAWDEAIGGSSPYSLGYGPRTYGLNSTGLLQIGNLAVSKAVNGVSLSSKDDILAYDIAYEVNQNLWDPYFLSGMPLKPDGSAFAWKPADDPSKLWNPRYQFNPAAQVNAGEVQSQLNGASDALSYGFWKNGYLLKNKGAFNVNSTSVEAWTAFLSGLHGLQRPTQLGTTGAAADSVFARVQKPLDGAKTNATGTDTKGGWAGGRVLTGDEIRALATGIVAQVKTRGPFVSLADFVNRRLAAKSNPSSMCGTLDEAIRGAGLNSSFEQAPFLTSTNNAGDNNKEMWKVVLDKQPKSKAWGIPGFLIQGDLLEPLAPAMTVRGDSFVIRCYGESRDAKGAIAAAAYLEALVARSPEYLDAASLNDSSPAAGSNKAIDPALLLDQATGAIQEGKLSGTNKRFGRRFILKSFRWLTANEV